MESITFVSEFKHYEDEEKGIKPYTIRKLTKRLKTRLGRNPTHIRIQKGYTALCFIRKITHTLEWDGWIIFAWNPNEVSPSDNQHTTKNKISMKNYLLYLL